MEKIDIQDVVNQEKISKLQWIIFALCFFVILSDGIDTGIVGFIAPSLIDAWGVTKNDLRPVMSVALIGMSIGAISSGILADKFGRKWVIIGATILFGAFTIISGMATNAAELTTFRFITGLGLGAAMPNAATLVSEYMPTRRRALMVNMLFCAFPLGITLGGLLAAGLLSIAGWEIILIISGTIPVVIAILAVFLLKESLHILGNKGKILELSNIFEQILGYKIDAKLISNYIKPEESIETAQPVKMVIQKYFVPSFMMWICCFISLFVFYVLTSWMPTLLKESGFTAEQYSLISAIFPFGGVIGTLVIGWLMDKLKPNKVLAISYFVSAIFFAITGILSENIYLLGLFIFLAGAGLVGSQSSLPSLAAIFYPAECRGVGVSWMHGIGRFGAIFGAFFGAYIFTFNLTINSIFILLAIPIMISAASLLIKDRYPKAREIKRELSSV